MEIQVCYFARIRELLQRDTESVQLPGDALTAGQVLDWLQARDAADWQQLPADWPVLFAVNQHMATSDTVVHAGDELGLFPPVTGG